MGARGPAPTPSKVLELHGSHRAKSRAKVELRTEVAAPPCPDWLSPAAQAEWQRQVSHLLRLGLVSQLDLGPLAVYCDAMAEFAELLAAIDRLKWPNRKAKIPRLDTVIQSGLLSARNKAADRLLKIAREFGFSPSARVRLQTDGRPPAGDTPPKHGKTRFFKPRLAKQG